MKIKQLIGMAVGLATVLVFLTGPSISAESIELVNVLMKNLGVTEEQAAGGSGAIFSMVKDKVSADDFSKIADAVPGMDSLLEAVPESGGLSKLVGSKTSLLGGSADKLGGLTSLVEPFSKLDLGSDMVGKYSTEIISYVKSKGGESAAGILTGVLK